MSSTPEPVYTATRNENIANRKRKFFELGIEDKTLRKSEKTPKTLFHELPKNKDCIEMLTASVLPEFGDSGKRTEIETDDQLLRKIRS